MQPSNEHCSASLCPFLFSSRSSLWPFSALDFFLFLFLVFHLCSSSELCGSDPSTPPSPMENRSRNVVRTGATRPEMRRWGTKRKREERRKKRGRVSFSFRSPRASSANIRAEWYRKLAYVTESKARWSLIWSRANERGGGGGGGSTAEIIHASVLSVS